MILLKRIIIYRNILYVLSMLQKWAEDFIKWFDEVKTDSKKPLDEHWDVDSKAGKDSIWIRAENPKEPYSVHVKLYGNFATLFVFTAIETSVMGLQERLDIYRRLLRLNDRWKMIKFSISGDNDEIVLKTDLNLNSLNRDEFCDALTVTLIGMNEMYIELGLEDVYKNAQMMHILDIIKSRNKKGESIEQIAQYLMNTFSVSKETAMNTIQGVLGPQKKEQDDHPGYMFH